MRQNGSALVAAIVDSGFSWRLWGSHESGKSIKLYQTNLLETV
jgi:hypothetical protein